MDPELLSRWRNVFVAFALLAVFPLSLQSFSVPPFPRPLDVRNNPDHFFLWATNGGYVYTFIYDPLAADIWLRERCLN